METYDNYDIFKSNNGFIEYEAVLTDVTLFGTTSGGSEAVRFNAQADTHALATAQTMGANKGKQVQFVNRV